MILNAINGEYLFPKNNKKLSKSSLLSIIGYPKLYISYKTNH